MSPPPCFGLVPRAADVFYWEIGGSVVESGRVLNRDTGTS